MVNQTNYSETREELFLNLILRNRPRAYGRGHEGYIGCVYNHDVYGGCTIGEEVSPEEAEELDRIGNPVSDNDVYEVLPQRLQDMGQDFLVSMQMLHDIYFGTPKFIPQARKVAEKYNLAIPPNLIIETYMNSRSRI